MIVSDHSPCTPALKKMNEKNLKDAWGGISSLQFGLSLIWTEAQKRQIPLGQIISWMSQKPADLIGMGMRKGRIAKGWDADFVSFSEKDTTTINKSTIHHRHKETPYEGWTGVGVVEETWLRGQSIYQRGKFNSTPRGERLI